MKNNVKFTILVIYKLILLIFQLSSKMEELMMERENEMSIAEEEIFQIWENLIDYHVAWCKSIIKELELLKELEFSSEKIIEINKVNRELNGVFENLCKYKEGIRAEKPFDLASKLTEEILCEEVFIMNKASALCCERISEVPSPQFGLIGFLLMPYTAISYHVKMFIQRKKMNKLKKRKEKLLERVEK